MENQRPIAKTAVNGMSIIVPVYNEAGSILSTIQELEEVMSSEWQEFEYNIITSFRVFRGSHNIW